METINRNIHMLIQSVKKKQRIQGIPASGTDTEPEPGADAKSTPVSV